VRPIPERLGPLRDLRWNTDRWRTIVSADGRLGARARSVGREMMILVSAESELPCTRPVPTDTPRLPELPFKRWKYRCGATRFGASAHRYDMRSMLISIC
jgi:hypothetical protein